MSQRNNDFAVWWHGIPALPAARDEQSYFALRRIWADQTINTSGGARSFYRWNTEDYLTPALWQTWAVFDDRSMLTSFLRSTGAQVGTLSRVRWAYACEEMPTTGPKIIPDIMLAYEDERGEGLIALEVKKPGIAAKAEDARKLEQYCRLPSTRALTRRHGCFLVSASAAPITRRNTNDSHSVVTWEELAEAQAEAAISMPVNREAASLTAAWIRRLFGRSGIGPAFAAPAPQGPDYGQPNSFDAIRAFGLPHPVERFLMGSECVESAYQNDTPSAPLSWLIEEPLAEEIRRPQYQTTDDRRVCRWRFTWSPRQESAYRSRRDMGLR